jgi:hypothetical protein
MSAMQIPTDRAATAHMSFFMLVFLFVSLPQHCAVRTVESESLEKVAEFRATPDKRKHCSPFLALMLSTAFIISRSLVFVFAELHEWPLDYSVPRSTLYHNWVTFWEKILKNFSPPKIHPPQKKGQKSSTPLISLGEIHFHHHENHP